MMAKKKNGGLIKILEISVVAIFVLISGVVINGSGKLCSAATVASKESVPSAEITIDPAHTAFVIGHYQNDICKPNGAIAGPLWKRIKEAHNIEHTQAALAASREKDVLVIHVLFTARRGGPGFPKKPSPLFAGFKKAILAGKEICVKGTWGHEVIDELKPLPLEPVLDNNGTNCFWGSDLDIILRANDIDTVVLAGIATARYVILSTTLAACDRGYYPIILQDCCNDESADLHNWIIKNVLSRAAVISDSKAYSKALHAK